MVGDGQHIKFLSQCCVHGVMTLRHPAVAYNASTTLWLDFIALRASKVDVLQSAAAAMLP
jgi:hypothetical protein